MSTSTNEHLSNIYLIEEISLIDEAFGDFLKKLNFNQLKQKIETIKTSAEKKDIKTLLKISPKFSHSKLKDLAGKNITDFKKNKDIAKKDLEKVGMPKQFIDLSSTTLALITDKVLFKKSLNKISKKSWRTKTLKEATKDWKFTLSMDVIMAAILALIATSTSTVAMTTGVFLTSFGALLGIALILFMIMNVLGLIVDLVIPSKLEEK